MSGHSKLGISLLLVASKREQAFEEACLKLGQHHDVHVAVTTSYCDDAIMKYATDLIILRMSEYQDTLDFLRQHKDGFLNQTPVIVIAKHRWLIKDTFCEARLYAYGAANVIFASCELQHFLTGIRGFLPDREQLPLFQGTTACIPIGTVLFHLASQKCSGLLTLSLAGKQVHFHFKHGFITAAESGNKPSGKIITSSDEIWPYFKLLESAQQAMFIFNKHRSTVESKSKYDTFKIIKQFCPAPLFYRQESSTNKPETVLIGNSREYMTLADCLELVSIHKREGRLRIVVPGRQLVFELYQGQIVRALSQQNVRHPANQKEKRTLLSRTLAGHYWPNATLKFEACKVAASQARIGYRKYLENILQCQKKLIPKTVS